MNCRFCGQVDPTGSGECPKCDSPAPLGHVKAAHQPRNARCPHNVDPVFDCTCKADVVKVRKPFRTVRVNAKDVDGKINPHIVLEVHPDGTLVLREQGRKMRYSTTVGAVYRGCMWRDAMMKAKAKKSARKRK